jgi:hypothetical protein
MESSNWRDNFLKKCLEGYELNWRKYLLWIPFFVNSSKLFDMHVENGLGLDCTHYIYSPYMMDFFWFDLLQTIRENVQGAVS